MVYTGGGGVRLGCSGVVTCVLRAVKQHIRVQTFNITNAHLRPIYNINTKHIKYGATLALGKRSRTVHAIWDCRTGFNTKIKKERKETNRKGRDQAKGRERAGQTLKDQ